MYSAHPFKFSSPNNNNPQFTKTYNDSNFHSSNSHPRGNSFDPFKNIVVNANAYNTPPRQKILQNLPQETNVFFSEPKILPPKNRFDERIKMSSQSKFQNGQLFNEIVDFMENKKQLENFQIKPNLYSYSNKINNNTIGKINNNEYSSPTKLINQRKGPIDITYNTFEKNQNLKPLLETQKINQDKTDEDLRATAQFGKININKQPIFKSEIVNPQIFHHKKNNSSGFESFKHQENIDGHLLADNKLYFDDSPPVSKQKQDDFNSTAIRFSYRTRKGFLINNPFKVNQDNFITCSFTLRQSICHLFAVCDGHGVYGHLVSYFIKQEFPNILRLNPQLEASPDKALFSSIKILENFLEKSNINLEISGSTFIVVLLINSKLFCANVGDSRAILALRTPSFFSKWEHIPLSIDHKPDLPKEAERILKAGGRIGAIQDYTGQMKGPKRVWKMKENSPGLAMSRSMGDLQAKSVGVTWEPEIMESTLDSKDKFIVVGSDGLWEFLGNEECANIVGLFFLKNDLEGACEYLFNEAYQRWIKNDDKCIDDITFIIIFLQNP